MSDNSHIFNKELVEDRLAKIYVGTLADNWWKSGQQAINGTKQPDGTTKTTMKFVTAGFLSKSSLQKVKFEMKAKVVNDPIKDLFDPLVKAITKFGARSNNPILKSLTGGDDPTATLQNILMITSSAAQQTGAKVTNDKGEEISAEGIRVPVPAIRIPVYEEIPYVSMSLDQSIDIEFLYGYHASEKGITELYNADECVFSPIRSIVNNLPKIEFHAGATEVSGRPDPSTVTAEIKVGMPTKPTFYGALLKGSKDIINSFFSKVKSLGVVKTDTGADSKVEKLKSSLATQSAKLLEAVQRFNFDESKSWTKSNVARHVDETWNWSMPNSAIKTLPIINDNNRDYFTEADYSADDIKKGTTTSDLLNKLSDNDMKGIDSVTNKLTYATKFEKARHEIFDPSLDENFNEITEANNNVGVTPTRSLYDALSDTNDSEIFLVAYDLLQQQNKLYASVLNNLEEMKVFALSLLNGKLVIGPFLPEQCSWWFDLSKGITGTNGSGAPMSGTFQFSKIKTVLPGTIQSGFGDSTFEIEGSTATTS